MEQDLKKSTKIKVIIITALTFLVTVLGITYAYFQINVTGNEQASSVTVTAALLRLEYSDTLVMSGTGIYPGWSQTKTVSVQNTGTDTVIYKILWRELLNEITTPLSEINEDLTSSYSSDNNFVSSVVTAERYERVPGVPLNSAAFKAFDNIASFKYFILFLPITLKV